MADTYWDPANLLQITFDPGPDGEIQCIGQTWRNNGARCRWTIPESAAIRYSLMQMSRKPPKSITSKEVEDLASRCLCVNYHASQVTNTVARWRTIIARAIQEQSRLAGAAKSDDEVLQLRYRLYKSEKEVSRHDAYLVALKGELSSVETEAGRLGRRLKHALNEIDEKNTANDLMRRRWQQSLNNEERCKSEAVSARSDHEAQLREAEGLADDIRKKLGKARADGETIEARLAEVNERLKQEERRREELADGLRAEETRHKETEGRLVAESVVLRQARSDLEATRRLNKLLEDKVRRHEATQAALEIRLGGSWLHRLCAWVRRFNIVRILLKSRWKPSSKEENVLGV
ncbi:hypothetical protein ACHAQH_004592 [Verticillium albo-atrum]